nr:unnamed protein product [Callosobruchus chinensis]
MFVIEFSAPAEVSIVSKEEEKRTKYQELLGQLRRLWPDYAVSLLVMVIGSLGGMRNTLLSALRAIPVCRAAAHILPARMQKAWARAHQAWLLPQWRNVLFSDESGFGLVSDYYRERVWRETGGQNRLATAIAIPMAWAPYKYNSLGLPVEHGMEIEYLLDNWIRTEDVFDGSDSTLRAVCTADTQI